MAEINQVDVSLLGCAICGSKTNLRIVPHKGKTLYMAGILFICQGCEDATSKKKMMIHISEVEEVPDAPPE